MDHQIEFDPRTLKYERLCRIVDGKGGSVSIDPGTRVYREIGRGGFFREWIEEVHRVFEGEVVPFEWVADYVGVTRASLHKRVKRGGLTVLCYEMQETVKGVLGGHRERMRSEYKFVPKRECDAWRELLAAPESEEDGV